MGGRGSSSGLGGQSVAEGKQYKAALQSAENRIKGNPTETAIVLDSKGNVLVDKSDGSTNSVIFTEAECQKMRGSTLTHNHPQRSTFSKEDIQLLTTRGLKSIRATSTEKTYQLTKLNSSGSKNAFDFHRDYAVAQAQNKAIVDVEYGRYERAYQNGQMTLTEFNNKIPGLNRRLNQLNSDWLKKNARSYGYRYSVIG